MAKSNKSKILCPKCYEPVFPQGSHHGESNIKVVYGHRRSQELDCRYHGPAPIGLAKAQRQGFSQAQSKALKNLVINKKYRRYVITSAQNATPVHKKAFDTVISYCNMNNAQLIVIPYRYKNPTSMWSVEAKHDDWWAKELEPYIMAERVSLSPHVLLLADIMIQPTADRPLNGLETIAGENSVIIGHPKLELMTVPTPQQKFPKLMTTTGAITVKNYIKSKAGKKGEHHHTYGASLVEVEGKQFHLRQINIKNDGSFCDLLSEYSGDTVHNYDRIPAIVMGDTHVEVIDPKVVSATFTDPDSMVNVLKPEQLVWHDVFDGTSINHHERGRLFHEFVKYKAGRRNVEQELDRTFDFIDKMTPPNTKNIFIPSNHNAFLQEWVENANPKIDPENGPFWAESYLAISNHNDTRWAPSGAQIKDVFAYWGSVKLKTAKQAVFIRRDQSYLINGIEVGYHGDKGSNGARGSRMTFRKIGIKSIIGHTHSPGITDGAYQVGTSSLLDLSYTAGSPSGWLQTHCLIYANGKRSLVNIIDGSWKIKEKK